MSDDTDENEKRRLVGFGTRTFPEGKLHQSHFGNLIVTCEGGELRASPKGVTIYGMEGKKDIELPVDATRPGYTDALDAFWNCVRRDQPDYHDAKWGKATLEIALATLRSSRERREVRLEHQI